jgi:hypothetical protein
MAIAAQLKVSDFLFSRVTCEHRSQQVFQIAAKNHLLFQAASKLATSVDYISSLPGHGEHGHYISHVSTISISLIPSGLELQILVWPWTTTEVWTQHEPHT